MLLSRMVKEKCLKQIYLLIFQVEVAPATIGRPIEKWRSHGWSLLQPPCEDLSKFLLKFAKLPEFIEGLISEVQGPKFNNTSSSLLTPHF